MSLYLCVFADEGELAGIDVGSYSDFGAFRAAVAAVLEGGAPGSRFPLLMLHSDCDGSWPAADCPRLAAELAAIAAASAAHPELEEFRDVDGENLTESLRRLVALAAACGRPILFQ